LAFESITFRYFTPLKGVTFFIPMLTLSLILNKKNSLEVQTKRFFSGKSTRDGGLPVSEKPHLVAMANTLQKKFRKGKIYKAVESIEPRFFTPYLDSYRKTYGAFPDHSYDIYCAAYAKDALLIRKPSAPTVLFFSPGSPKDIFGQDKIPDPNSDKSVDRRPLIKNPHPFTSDMLLQCFASYKGPDKRWLRTFTPYKTVVSRLPVQSSGNKRAITHLTNRSKRRMLFVLRNCGVNWKSFHTMTYPRIFPKNGKTFKKHLREFFIALRFKLPGHKYFWFMEFQERGAVHYHFWSTATLEEFESAGLAAT